jgi:hypothetical protein
LSNAPTGNAPDSRPPPLGVVLIPHSQHRPQFAPPPPGR